MNDGDVVLDIGAGLGEFLRHITCGQRIAVDNAPMVGRTLPPGSIEITASADEIASQVSAGSVDVVRCSNVFEHLRTPTRFLTRCARSSRCCVQAGACWF